MSEAAFGVFVGLVCIAYAIMGLAVAVALHNEPASLEKVRAIIWWPAALAVEEDRG